MAEQIPYGVAESIIKRLASLAFREFGRIYGVSTELEKLKNTLELIQAELSDAEERQEEVRAVKIWIRRLKEVLHDADNLFDDLVIEDLRRKVNSHSKVVSQVRDFFSSKNQLAFRHKIARKVEKIRQQFDDVSSVMSKLNLRRTVVISKENESAWRETSSFVLQSDIIGREESKKEIIDLLKQTNTNQNVSLIAIVGIGGLGKTALAQLVYNDAEVKDSFQKKMWVCVSEDFEVETVLCKILVSLNESATGHLHLDQIQKKLQEELNGQRYILVLDDVWNESQLKWDALKTYLMCGGEGSKILVTTRSKIVTQTMGIDIPYILNGLTKEQSQDLLKNLAFGKDVKRMSPNLLSIGERIADKCGGVPLAIRTMGGLLKSKNEESEWSNILEGDCWRECEKKEGKDSIMPVLKLSYQHLPLEIRQCFAYCSLYPKDRQIKKDELIQLWMAQGYLESSIETQSMEDVGNEYVKILLMRSFFQEASMSEYNDITSFKMHDLMHDLAQSVAGKDCYLDSEGKGIGRRPMHVSFASSSVCSLHSLDASKMRTILGARNQIEFVSKPSIIKNLKYLRVMDLSWSSITELPKSIDKLKHLKYLDLSYCYKLISLPESIGNLVSLQTLKLRGCEKLVFSVEIITKLICLRYLDIDNCKAFEDGMPVGVGKLTSLQYLPELVAGKDQKMKLNELKDLNNIKDELIISNLGLVEDVASESREANLKAKKYIHRLELLWGRYKYGSTESENRNSDSLELLDNLGPHSNLRELWVSQYPGVRFSSWLPSLTNIVQITLIKFSNCQQLPPLERLPLLKTLYIHDMDELKYMDYEEISDVFFPSLESLFVSWCKNLRGWKRVGDGNNSNDIVSLPPFPRLSSLEIYGCRNLQLSDKLCPRQNLRELSVIASPGPGVRCSSWLPSLTNIVKIKLWSFSNCHHLPPLERLPLLKSLCIILMDELKYMDYEEISDVFFPSLETLSLVSCRNLRGWEKVGDGNNANDIVSLPPFPCLSSLQIDICPKLTCMPTYPHLAEKLELRSSSVTPLIETCLGQLQSCSFYPLSGLKELEIGEIDVEEMPDHWMQYLTSLERLSIGKLPSNGHLLRHLQRLPAQLQLLQFVGVDELDLWKDEEDVSTQCQAPHALRALHRISIKLGNHLKALPEWICDLQSLQHIEIDFCWNLASLPEGMRRLTNLHTLDISGCPLLRDSCQTEIGEDWPKISHIPNITIK